MIEDKAKESASASELTDTEISSPGSRDLTARVASGAFWSGLSRVCVQLLYLISIAVLTRKLDPEAYGLMNMTQIVVGFVSLFRDIGIGSAIIQKREIDGNLVTSLWWISIALGVITTLVCIAISPLVAVFYKQPLVSPMLQVLAFSFLITSITTVHGAMLNRRMAFRQIAIVEIAAAFVSLIVAVAFAYSGRGVWSLVAASLASSATASLGFLVVYRWKPALRCSWADVRGVTGFGMNLSGFNVLNYFSRNADNVLIGRYIGSAPLGFYQLAYTFMLYPVQNVAQLLGRVLFPAFSEIQNDHARFRRAYIRSLVVIALISFPLMAGAAAVAKPFVFVWMGPTWLTVATLITILAPVGMYQAVGTTVGQIYTATGRTDFMFKWGLISSPIIVLSFFAGLPWGITGVAISYAVVMGLLAYPLFLIPCRLIELPVREVWKAIQPIALAAGLMFLAVFLTERSISRMQPLWILCICVPVGAIVYFAAIKVFASEALNELRTIGQAIPARYHWGFLHRLFSSSV